MPGGAAQSKTTNVDSARPNGRNRTASAADSPELPPDSIGYIAALCAELSAMARMGGCADLAYFLEMARVEAATILLRREEQPLSSGRKG